MTKLEKDRDLLVEKLLEWHSGSLNLVCAEWDSLDVAVLAYRASRQREIDDHDHRVGKAQQRLVKELMRYEDVDPCSSGLPDRVIAAMWQYRQDTK